MNGPPPAFLSDTNLRLSLNFNPGEALGELDIDLGEGNELKLGGAHRRATRHLANR